MRFLFYKKALSMNILKMKAALHVPPVVLTTKEIPMSHLFTVIQNLLLLTITPPLWIYIKITVFNASVLKDIKNLHYEEKPQKKINESWSTT